MLLDRVSGIYDLKSDASKQIVYNKNEAELFHKSLFFVVWELRMSTYM